MAGDETVAVCPHWSKPLMEIPVCGWATIAGLEVSHGTTCMGIGPRKVRLNKSDWRGQQPAPVSFLKLVSSSYRAPALSQHPCPALGRHKSHKAESCVQELWFWGRGSKERQ